MISTGPPCYLCDKPRRLHVGDFMSVTLGSPIMRCSAGYAAGVKASSWMVAVGGQCSGSLKGKWLGPRLLKLKVTGYMLTPGKAC
jgi:hypothetical protein